MPSGLTEADVTPVERSTGCGRSAGSGIDSPPPSPPSRRLGRALSWEHLTETCKAQTRFTGALELRECSRILRGNGNDLRREAVDPVIGNLPEAPHC
jgi:hypothetical protein